MVTTQNWGVGQKPRGKDQTHAGWIRTGLVRKSRIAGGYLMSGRTAPTSIKAALVPQLLTHLQLAEQRWVDPARTLGSDLVVGERWVGLWAWVSMSWALGLSFRELGFGLSSDELGFGMGGALTVSSNPELFLVPWVCGSVGLGFCGFWIPWFWDSMGF